MRTASLALLLAVAACGGGSSNQPAPAPAAPEPAPVAPDGDPVQGRRDLAIGFVAAVAHRDQAAIDKVLAVNDFCSMMIAESGKDVPANAQQACVDEMTANNAEALVMYRQVVAETFEPGETEELAIDAAQGIYMVTVRPKGFDASAPGAEEQGVVVTVIEHGGRRFVVFPRRK